MICRHCGEIADWEVKTLTPDVCEALGVSAEPFQTCTECMAVWIISALMLFDLEKRAALLRRAGLN